MRRATSAAARTGGASTSSGEAFAPHDAGAPNCRSTAPWVAGASNEKLSAGSGSRGTS